MGTGLRMEGSLGTGPGQKTEDQGLRTRNQDPKIENLSPATEGQGQETKGLDLGTGSLDLAIVRTDLGPGTRRRKTGGRGPGPEIDITRNIKRTGPGTDAGPGLDPETVNIEIETMTTVRS